MQSVHRVPSMLERDSVLPLIQANSETHHFHTPLEPAPSEPCRYDTQDLIILCNQSGTDTPERLYFYKE